MDIATLNASSYSLSEEVARWRFELDVRANREWWIAFTNPTAGPWKRCEGRNIDGVVGEVLRFERDSERPDLVLVCDAARAIVIIEAKETLAQLAVPAQLQKSCAVVQNLEKRLSEKGGNPFWGERASYTVIPGVLWGRPHGTGRGNFPGIAASWLAVLGSVPFFGVEVAQDASGALTCQTIWHRAPKVQLPSFHA